MQNSFETRTIEIEVPRASESGQLQEVTGEETPEHIMLEFSFGVETRPLPLVLSFRNLTYNVKISPKMKL